MINIKKVLNIFGNLSVAFLSILITLTFLEGVSRVILNPVDYLRPETIDDPILGRSIKPGSGGHDMWGFRNEFVPDNAQIVTIGDSQTYGVSATASNSWPSILQQISGKSVYNLSLGGYSPVQYHYLLAHKAINLDPEFVVVGFYYGNDLLETYNIVKTNQNWKHLKNSDFPVGQPKEVFKQAFVTSTKNRPSSYFLNVRGWLAQNSMVYRMIIYSGIGEIARTVEAKFLLQNKQDNNYVEYDKNGINTVFTPEARLKVLNLKDPFVEEGLHIDLELLAQMNDYCIEHNIHLLVVLIPTKEHVFAELIEDDTTLESSNTFHSLFKNERAVNKIVKSYLQDHNIAYIDVLPELQQKVDQIQLYPSNFDGHPNKNGYHVIAETIGRYIQ